MAWNARRVTRTSRPAPRVAGARPRGPRAPAASTAVPPSVRAAAAWSACLLLVVAAAAVVLWLVAALRVLVVSVAVAVLLAVLLAPAAAWLRRVARFPAWLACAVAVLGLVLGVGGLVTVAGRSVVGGLGDLVEQAFAGAEQALAWLADGPLAVDAEQLAGLVDRAQAAVQDNAGVLLAGALSATVTAGQVAAGTLIALFCAFFFLRDGAAIWAWTVGLLPRTARDRVHAAGLRGLVTVSAYTRTQVLVGAVDALGIGLGAALLQVPLALPITVLVFVASFVPFVGAISTGAIAVLVALVAQGPVTALLMLGVVLLVQQVEGNVLQPFLMGHAVRLHPVAVLLAVTAGSLVAGIAGALFAVPVVAAANTMVRALHEQDAGPGTGRAPA